MVKAAYIHIPFCEQICHYCDFNKVFLKNQPVDQYVETVLMEIQRTGESTGYEALRTLYIGGGTPTALSAAQLERLLSGISAHLPLEQIEEWTVEVNPDSSEQEKLEVMKAYGVNRLSIGAQTFEPELLKAIGRTHSANSVFEAIERSRAVGFSNLSIDLMFGLPGQTPELFAGTIQQAIALGIEHISAYSLKVEAKTVFYNLQRKGKLSLPPEDDEVQMYEQLRTISEANGLRQYEISNFARRGFESQHNRIYWDNEEYFGFGAGAHGYVNGTRYQNHGPIAKYINAVREGRPPYLQKHDVTEIERLEEAMFMGLRLVDGLNERRFQQRYGYSFFELYRQEINELIAKKLLAYEQGALKLTEKGLLLGNEVFEKFIATLTKLPHPRSSTRS